MFHFSYCCFLDRILGTDISIIIFPGPTRGHPERPGAGERAEGEAQQGHALRAAHRQVLPAHAHG